MGYNLYITRAKSWLDAGDSPIPQSAWDELVATDPELERSTVDYFEQSVGGKTKRYYDVKWLAHREAVPFFLVNGAIEVKNPDEATVIKMVQMARQLDAHVIGEDDEEYGPDGKQRPSD